jgi:hypothetical protein
MGHHDTALICMNGHVINERYNKSPELNTKFCKNCGAATINSCIYCGASILGKYEVPGIVVLSTISMSAPSYCHNCGKPYPWTEERLKAIREAIGLSEISEQEKEEFNNNLPDIMSETPRTKIAALKIKTIGAKVSKEIWSVAREIIVDIASETAKKIIGL